MNFPISRNQHYLLCAIDPQGCWSPEATFESLGKVGGVAARAALVRLILIHVVAFPAPPISSSSRDDKGGGGCSG